MASPFDANMQRKDLSRVRGFQSPYTLDQMTTWVLQPAASILFNVLCAHMLPGAKSVWILVPYNFLCVALISGWFYCSSVDPSDDKKGSVNLGLPIPMKPKRYCTVCRKHSPGLDHHCTWLNTCIAESNYGVFLYMITFAMVQSLLQAIVGFCIVTIWYDEAFADITDNRYHLSLIWLHNAIAVGLTLGYGFLTGFHYYLLYLRMGTYCWLLQTKKIKKRPSKEPVV